MKTRRFSNVALVLSLISLLVLATSCGEDEEEEIEPELGDTHKLSATIPVGEVPFDVAVTPDGQYVYVTNGEDDTVSIISTVSNSVAKVISVDEYPGGIVVSPDGEFVYVGHFDDHTLAVISTASQEVTEMVDVRDDLEGMMVISPDGATIYASDFPGAGSINIISVASKQIVGFIDLKPSIDIAITPDGKWLYAINPVDEALMQISTASRQVTSSIPLSRGAHDYTNLAISPDGDFVYIPVQSLVVVISTASKEIVQSITVTEKLVRSFDLTGIAVSPDGKFVYVANAEQDSITIISTETNSITDTIIVGRRPINIAVSPDGRAIYVTTFQDNSVSVITRE